MKLQRKILLVTFAIILFHFGQASAQSVSDPIFTCRYYGEDYQIGARICLSTSGDARQATCGMVLNNSAWKVSAIKCSPVTEKKDRTTSKAQEYVDKYIRDYHSNGKSK
jgi:hypothetical protein|tara:strand:+ start:2090 stop:2416 length:327 start_codon:yes stop_codon:yes gene_type:complete